MKTIFSIFAILVLVALVVGCGTQDHTTTPDVTDNAVNEQPQLTDKDVQTEIDDLVVPENDSVELGELI